MTNSTVKQKRGVNTCYGRLDQRSNLSRDEFMEKYGVPRKPVAILDETKDWKAMSLWTFDFLKSEYGLVEVKVRNLNGEVQTITMGDYIDYINAPNGRKTIFLEEGWNFADLHPELLTDYSAPLYFNNWLDRVPINKRRRSCWRWFFIGPQGSGSSMHTDTMDSSAWLTITKGRKKWIFFSPEDEPYLYEGKVDAFNPDLDKFPLFAQASPIHYTQHPGEIVYIPSLWWHQVLNETDCIALTENFVNETNSDLFRAYLLKHNRLDALERLAQFIPELKT